MARSLDFGSCLIRQRHDCPETFRLNFDHPISSLSTRRTTSRLATTRPRSRSWRGCSRVSSGRWRIPARASARPARGASSATSRSACAISIRSSASRATGPHCRAAANSSPRISTSPIPGSSRTSALPERAPFLLVCFGAGTRVQGFGMRAGGSLLTPQTRSLAEVSSRADTGLRLRSPLCPPEDRGQEVPGEQGKAPCCGLSRPHSVEFP